MATTRRLRSLQTQAEAVLSLPADPLAVALSGGADSAALLWLCVQAGRDVRAIHVHHGLPASDMLAAAAGSIAASLDVPLEVRMVTVDEGPSPEDQARRARYRAFADARRPDEWILTAHTSDDQAETVLDRLLRSSGIDGLAGIPERRPPFARPILGLSRSITREIAALAGLAWRDDPVNLSPEPLRNRIRNHLIPALEAEYNPRLRESLATTARLVGRTGSFMDGLVEDVPVYQDGSEVAMAASVLSTSPAVMAARLARRFLAAGGLGGASPEAVAGVIAVAAGEIRSHQPGAGLEVRKRGAMVVAQSEPPLDLGSVALSVPGDTVYGAWRFVATVSGQAPAAMPLGAGWMVADAGIGTDLTVAPASGFPDALRALAKAGVVAPDRGQHPVIVSGDEVVWVPSVRRFPLGWIDAATERYLVIRSQTERTCQT